MDNPGLLGLSPANYTYANAIPQQAQTFQVKTPMAGMSSIADALINGYSNYLGQQQPALSQNQANGLSNLMSNLSLMFNGGNSLAPGGYT